jgi:hypothetical protein
MCCPESPYRSALLNFDRVNQWLNWSNGATARSVWQSESDEIVLLPRSDSKAAPSLLRRL